jgi:hypothetical protein
MEVTVQQVRLAILALKVWRELLVQLGILDTPDLLVVGVPHVSLLELL